jgi:uncharacterized protein YfbU (UPF0304 family)
MATIAVRVDDDVRDALQELARAQGLTLSDFVRDLLREAIVPIPGTQRGDLAAMSPSSLSEKDRLMFSLLHRILARVLPSDSNDVDGDKSYQLNRALVLERGFTSEYTKEYASIDPELSRRDCLRVMDILDMFRITTFSAAEATKAGVVLDEDVLGNLRFVGFDFNDELEGQMANYVQYLVAQGKWSEVRPVLDCDNGNSHGAMLPSYLRMLAEFRRILDNPNRQMATRYLLDANELQAVSDASNA